MGRVNLESIGIIMQYLGYYFGGKHVCFGALRNGAILYYEN